MLLIEDNPGDARLFQEVIRDLDVPVIVEIEVDARRALARLRREDGAGDPRPDLVLLDLSLPVLSGIEFLAARAEEPRLREPPVVVFTSSTSVDEIRRALALGANAFVPKPIDFLGFRQAVERVLERWMGVRGDSGVTPSN